MKLSEVERGYAAGPEAVIGLLGLASVGQLAYAYDVTANRLRSLLALAPVDAVFAARLEAVRADLDALRTELESRGVLIDT